MRGARFALHALLPLFSGCAAGELLVAGGPDGPCGAAGVVTLGDWLTLGAVPTMQVRLAIDFSASPYRLGRDVLVEIQARDTAGTIAPLTKGAAWLQLEQRCASDDSLAGCSELLVELTSWREATVRPAFMSASTSTALNHSWFRGTVALHECLDSTRADVRALADVGVRKKWFAAVAEGSVAAAPLNLPQMVANNPNETNLVASLVPSAEHPTKLRLRRPSEWSEDWKDPWRGSGQKVTPLWHFPFFSNCEGFDGRIPIEQALEDPERCSIVPTEETIAISQYTWGAVDRYSDHCDYVLRCAYEEDHRDLRDDIRPPAWPRTLDGDILFYMTGQPALEDLGLCVDGDCGKLYTMLNHQVLRFVKVSYDMRPKGAYIPRRIELEVRYWQKTVTQKMLINAAVKFSEWSAVPWKDDDASNEVDISGIVSPPRECVPYEDASTGQPITGRGFWLRCHHRCEDGNCDTLSVPEHQGLPPQKDWPHWRAYTLRVRLVPVDWMEVLNAFSLNTLTYVIFYFSIAGMLVVSTFMLWAAVRAYACLRGLTIVRLEFRFWLRYLFTDAYAATMMIFFPLAWFCLWLLFVFRGTGWWESLPYGDYFSDVSGIISDEEKERLLAGRIGLGLATLGLCTTRWAIQLWTPSNAQGNRGPLWRSTALLMVFCSLVLHLSQSAIDLPTGSTEIVFLLKFLIMVIEPLLVHAATDQAMAMQCVVLEVTLLLSFVAAEGFISFITLNVIEYFFNVGKRFILEPLKWSCFGKRKLAMLGISDNVAAARERDLANKVQGALPDGATEVMVVWTIELSAQIIEQWAIAILYLFRKEFDISASCTRLTLTRPHRNPGHVPFVICACGGRQTEYAIQTFFSTYSSRYACFRLRPSATCSC